MKDLIAQATQIALWAWNLPTPLFVMLCIACVAFFWYAVALVGGSKR